MSAPNAAPVSREESFPAAGTAVEVDVKLGAGAVTVELTDAADTVDLTVRAAPGSWWQEGLSGVLSMLGAADSEPAPDVATAAVQATDITYSPSRSRLTVRAPRSGVARTVDLQVHLRAPRGADVFVRTATARVEVLGTARRVDIGTGSGEVIVQDVTDHAQVRTGSAGVRLGALNGHAEVRTGSGDISVDSVAGDLGLISGSGELRIGVGSGVAAELDLRAGAGTVRSELDVAQEPPAEGGVHVRARTGSGDILVHGAR